MKFLIKKYLPEFVYGSVDGVVTTIAIITGAIGAGLSAPIIFILGMANVLADAWSMGSSEYLSSLSEIDMEKTKEGKEEALKKGLITFGSFVAVGLIPVIPFFITILLPSFADYDLTLSLILAFLAFIFIGYIGARVTKTSHRKSILRTVFVGTLAALISFGVGHFLRKIT